MIKKEGRLTSIAHDDARRKRFRLRLRGLKRPLDVFCLLMPVIFQKHG